MSVGNAPLTPHSGNHSAPSNAAGRDAGQKAGIESGCSIKSRISLADGDLGKHMHEMGNPAWDKTPSESIGPTVGPNDRGSGSRHTLKNG